MSLPYLKSLEAVDAALQAGSLKQAAAALSITPAAAGQRIKALEEFLGVDLLVRTRAGLRAAPELEGALPHLQRAFAELKLAADALDLQRTDEIRIAAVSDWADLWLTPRLAQFRARHPNVMFAINGAGDAPQRIGRVDCEVVFAPLEEKSTGRSPAGETDILFHDYLAPVGSPANERRVRASPDAERLEGFPLLHLDFYKDDAEALTWPDWIARYGGRFTAPERGIRFQRVTTALEAVRSDAGFVIAGLALLADHIARAEVSLPFPAAAGQWTAGAFQARYRPGALRKPAMRAFRKWLSAEAAASAERVAALVASH